MAELLFQNALYVFAPQSADAVCGQGAGVQPLLQLLLLLGSERRLAAAAGFGVQSGQSLMVVAGDPFLDGPPTEAGTGRDLGRREALLGQEHRTQTFGPCCSHLLIDKPLQLLLGMLLHDAHVRLRALNNFWCHPHGPDGTEDGRLAQVRRRARRQMPDLVSLGS